MTETPSKSDLSPPALPTSPTSPSNNPFDPLRLAVTRTSPVPTPIVSSTTIITQLPDAEEDLDLTMSWTNILPSSEPSDPFPGPSTQHIPDPETLQHPEPLSSSLSSLTSLSSSLESSQYLVPPHLNPDQDDHLSDTASGSTLSEERGTISAAESESVDESGSGSESEFDERDERQGRGWSSIDRDGERFESPREGDRNITPGLNHNFSSNHPFWSTSNHPSSFTALPHSDIPAHGAHSHSISDSTTGFSSYIDGEQYTNTTASSSTNTLLTLRRGPVALPRIRTSEKETEEDKDKVTWDGEVKDDAPGQSVLMERIGDELVWPSWPLSSSGLDEEPVIAPSAIIPFSSYSHSHVNPTSNPNSRNLPHRSSSNNASANAHNFRADLGDVDRRRFDHEFGIGIGIGKLVGKGVDGLSANHGSDADLVGSFVEIGDGLRRECSRSSEGSEAWTDDLDLAPRPQHGRPHHLSGDIYRSGGRFPAPSRSTSRICQIDQKWLDGLVDSTSIALPQVNLSLVPSPPLDATSLDSTSTPYERIFTTDLPTLNDDLPATLASSSLLDPDWPFSKETIEKYALCGGILDLKGDEEEGMGSLRTSTSRSDGAKKIALLALPLLVLGIWATLSSDSNSPSTLFKDRPAILRNSSIHTPHSEQMDTHRDASLAIPIRQPPQYTFIRTYAAQASPAAGHDTPQAHDYYTDGPYGWNTHRTNNSLSIRTDRSLAVRHLGGSIPRWSCRFGRRSRGSNCSSSRTQGESHVRADAGDYGLERLLKGNRNVGGFVHPLNLSHASSIVAVPLATLSIYGGQAVNATRELVTRLRSYIKRASSALATGGPILQQRADAILQQRADAARMSLARLGQRAGLLGAGGAIAIRGLLDDIASLRHILLRLVVIEPSQIVRSKLRDAVVLLSDIHLRASMGQAWDAVGKSTGDAAGSLRDKLDHVQVSLSIPRFHLLDKAWRRAGLGERYQVASLATEQAWIDMQSAVYRLSIRMGRVSADGVEVVDGSRYTSWQPVRDMGSTRPPKSKHNSRDIKSGWGDSLMQAFHHTGLVFVR